MKIWDDGTENGWCILNGHRQRGALLLNGKDIVAEGELRDVIAHLPEQEFEAALKMLGEDL